MTNTSHTQKESILRALAVLGLVALVILIAWLSVQIVRVAPSAFSSLASLAEGLSSYEENVVDETPLTVTGPEEPVEAGESATLAWDQSEGRTYSFSYECIEGATVSVASDEGNRAINCGETYDLGTSADVSLVVESTDEGVAIPYQVLVFSENSSDPIQTGTGTLRVLNTSLIAEVAGESTTATTTEEVTEPEETVEEPVTTPAEETPEETTTQFTFAVPTSNPNGFVDLAATYVGVGTNSGLTSSLEKDSSGVFFFEVINNGTKTSETWEFTVELPGGATYQSESQVPLRPNEQATLALTVTTDDDNNHNFQVEVETDEDRNDNNNTFSQRVRFTD